MISPDLFQTTDSNGNTSPNPNAPNNPTDIMKQIRNTLLQPRRALSVKFNGIELIPKMTYVLNPNTNPPTTITPAVDAANGPKPQSCNIIELTNTTFMVTYHIIANYWEKTSTSSTIRNGVPNPNTPVAGNSILFNRWSESMDIDFANMTRRYRDGIFRIRSDNDVGLVADQLRLQMGVLGVPAGFLREGSTYKVQPDGLAIQYRVTDKEQYKMPPYPAYKAKGTYTESTTRFGVAKFCEVKIHLWGAKAPPGPSSDFTNNQTALLRVAVAIATSKLRIQGAPITGAPSQRAILDSGIVSVNLFENEVEVQFRAYKACIKDDGTGNKRTDGIGGINWTNITKTPGCESGPGGNNSLLWPTTGNTPNYNFYGSASRLLHAAAYYDPALRNQFINQGFGLVASTGLEPGQAGIQGEVG